MAEEQISTIFRPPSRNDLQKFLPDHESIIFIEKLFRSAGGALPVDIARLFELIEQFGDTVVKITDDYIVPVDGNFSIMANAATKEIDVTLPLASASDSFIVGTTKIDTSTNRVRILPTGTDTIAGEAFQDLLFHNEVLNFISDGINWQLAN